MATIYLIRHGQASFGKENYDLLSDKGEAQASRLGETLARRIPLFEQIVMGSMHRHQQTAHRCLKAFNADLETIASDTDAGWNEYDHQDILRQFRPEFATAAGMTEFIAKQANPKQAFEENFNAAVNRWMTGEHNEDYLESWDEFRMRVRSTLENLLERHSDKKSVAVFTSGGPISLIGQSLMGVPAERLMHMNWTLVNCGVTKLVSTGSRVFVATLNEHTHFEGDNNKHFITYS